jgi:hypothetical protein
MDQIVAELERSEGEFNVLLAGILNSPQFQRRREPDSKTTALK